MNNRDSTVLRDHTYRPRRALRTTATDSFAWIFRTNLPPRQGAPLPSLQKRNFFGFGEVLSVLLNPAETLRSLEETRKALEDARADIRESYDESQLRSQLNFSSPSHVVSRTAELAALHRTFSGSPTCTIVLGPPSVGKTTLLKEALSSDSYHVLHFDLRVPGFTDLPSFVIMFCRRIEVYFAKLTNIQGYEEFEKVARIFRHERMTIERLIEEHQRTIISPNDIAYIVDLLYNVLLQYRGFQPIERSDEDFDGFSSEETKIGHIAQGHKKDRSNGSSKTIERLDESEKNGIQNGDVIPLTEKENEKAGPKHKPITKRIPFIFFDEAHKLPHLIRSFEVTKYLIGALVALSNQDQLCHVVLASSDSLFPRTLERYSSDIMQRCKVISINDCSRSEMRAYFTQRLLPTIPAALRAKLVPSKYVSNELPPDVNFERKVGADSGVELELEKDEMRMFEELHTAFGGRLVHWSDYISDWVNAGGDLSIERSSAFVQAYTLLNLQLLYAADAECDAREDEDEDANIKDTSQRHARPGRRLERLSFPRALRQFSAYSSLGRDSMQRMEELEKARDKAREKDRQRPAFRTMELLDVMYRLSSSSSSHSVRCSAASCQIGKARQFSGMGAGPNVDEKDERQEGGEGSIAYFALSKELGLRAVDDMVRRGILDIRWVRPVRSDDSRANCSDPLPAPAPQIPASNPGLVDSTRGEATYVDDMEPVTDVESYPRRAGKDKQTDMRAMKQKDLDGIGPTLHPSSPIMRYAMRVVLSEWGYDLASASRHNLAEDEEIVGDEEDELRADQDGGVEGGQYPAHYHYDSHGHESSGLSDDKSDYVSLSDVSEY